MRISLEEYKALLEKSEKRKARPNKYNAVKTEFKGESFDSQKERDYYLILLDKERRGEIRYIKRQYKIEIQPSFIDKDGKKIRAINYIADFYYYDKLRKSWIIADVKGGEATKTAVYKLKKKLLAYKGIYIEEV